MREKTGQMAVEMAVLLPVTIVVALIVVNIARFVSLCALFDRTAKDAVLTHGVSVSADNTLSARTREVERALEEIFGDFSGCETSVRVISESSAIQGLGLAAIVCFRCEIRCRPWPSHFVVAGIDADIPPLLTHAIEIAVDVGGMGVSFVHGM